VLESFVLATYSPTAIGWVAIAAGAAGFAALILAILTFSLGRMFGRLDDMLVALTALLTAGLAMLLFPQHNLRAPELAQYAFGFGLVGAFVTAFGAVLAATEATSWFVAQLYVAAGNGLLGIWLVMLNYSAGAFDDFPNAVVTMGVFAGAVMALGIAAIPGLLMGSRSERSAPWITKYVGRAGNLGWLVIYPLWCIWLGQAFLRA
jgi:hypothetical protein